MALEWNGDQVLAAVQAAGDAGLLKGAEHILNKSNSVVPHETGDLERSGIAAGERGQAVVSYNTPYAVIQHEALDYVHKGKGQAKYLETALNQNGDMALDIINANIRRATS